MTDIQDRARGALVGLAVGDALGVPLEFKERGEFHPVTDMQGGGAFRLPLGYWTDDTSMAICLAESIIATGTINPDDLLSRFVRWFQHGENSSTGVCFDIGTTTKSALLKYQYFKKTKATDYFLNAGNGSIMRLAPVAIKWFSDSKTCVEMAKAQSITTHGAKLCLEHCEELAGLLAAAISGQDIHPHLQKFATEQAEPVPNSGYVLDTMIAAKWAVGKTTNFDDAILLAVNQGGDADTIGAVAGQIAGAIYGMNAIRQSWRNQLIRIDDLINLADQLHGAV